MGLGGRRHGSKTMDVVLLGSRPPGQEECDVERGRATGGAAAGLLEVGLTQLDCLDPAAFQYSITAREIA